MGLIRLRSGAREHGIFFDILVSQSNPKTMTLQRPPSLQPVNLPPQAHGLEPLTPLSSLFPAELQHRATILDAPCIITIFIITNTTMSHCAFFHHHRNHQHRDSSHSNVIC